MGNLLIRLKFVEKMRYIIVELYHISGRKSSIQTLSRMVFFLIFQPFFQSELKIETQSCFCIRTYLPVCNRDMCRVNGIALEYRFVFKGRIEQNVCIGGGQSFREDLDFKKTGDLSRKSFQTFLDACLDGGLFLCGEGVCKLSENDVLCHFRISPVH